MKYFLLILLIIVFSFPLYSADLITITEVKGKVEIKEPGGAWIRANDGREIPPGSIISTGFNSSAELDLSGSSTVYIKPLTRMAVDKLVISGKNVDTELNLKLGRIRADVKTAEGLKHNFSLKTPVSTAAVRGTIFESSVRKLEVVTGRISYSNNIGQKTTVGGGGTSSVEKTGFTPPATVVETVIETFTVETSTQPDEGVPEILVPPPKSTTGTIYVTWDLDEPVPM